MQINVCPFDSGVLLVFLLRAEYRVDSHREELTRRRLADDPAHLPLSSSIHSAASSVLVRVAVAVRVPGGEYRTAAPSPPLFAVAVRVLERRFQ